MDQTAKEHRLILRYLPMDAFAASTTSFALSSSPSMSASAGMCSSVKFDLFSTNLAIFAYK